MQRTVEQVDLTGVPERKRTTYHRVDDEHDRRSSFETGQDEQHGVGEVHAVDRLQREPARSR
jgi:hypothetical protein